ncbi:MAG: hypothetical protein IKA74_05940 [Clostridia bacterium]|nr:hypothetical protein [Clostridia bacterium]
MKKLLSLLLAVMMIAVLSFILVSCDEDSDGSTTTTTTTTTSTTTSTTSAQKQRYQVRIIDQMTGNVLETRNVTSGNSVVPLNDYKDLHYGYKINLTKYQEALAQKITKETDVYIEYLPKEVYTVRLQNANGSVYEGYTYEFKERLTPEQILAGKDTLIFANSPQNANKANDYSTVTLENEIKVYEGDSILSIPTAPISALGEFENWLVVTGYNSTSFAGGAESATVFTGSAVDKSYVVRASYKSEGAVIYINEFSVGENPLLNLNVADRWNADTSDYTKYNDADLGNEFVTYGSDPSRIDWENGTFKLAHTFNNRLVWHADGTTHTPATTNKFTGNSDLGTWDIQLDEHTFVTYDGSKLYMYIVIRDDTPFYPSDRDHELIESDPANRPGNFFAAGDGIEFRFLFGSKVDLPMSNAANGTVDVQNTTSETCLRTLVIDRKGRINLRNAEPATAPQLQYLSVADLDSESASFSKELYDANEKNVGYVIGLVFDINSYVTDNFVGTDDGKYATVGDYWAANNDLFKLTFGIQINDRFTGLLTTEGDPAPYFIDLEESTKRVANLYGKGNKGCTTAGCQTHYDSFSVITVVNYEEEPVIE